MSLLAITFPIFVILINRFVYGQAIVATKLFGLVLVLFGVITLLCDADWSLLTQLEFATGDLLMLVAAFSFAVYSMMLAKRPSEVSGAPLQLGCFIIGWFMLLPFYGVERALVGDYQIDSQAWLSILYIGIAASLISYLLWGYAISKIGAEQAGFIYYLLPLFSAALSVVLLGETIHGWEVGCGLIIIVGILVSQWPKHAKKKD
ncbi:hypothetical protein GCM10007894_21140 [Paraferrimonas haliotis]|uniref:EamA domain-containing protein n=2 Tax=Paraferrimonas haliotis TaxID=2013866 RepID=A0AA37WX90_9GAMM|nr:hypothetical protein GCM10007894_21140 [Paraferrimonas haliotis]